MAPFKGKKKRTAGERPGSSFRDLLGGCIDRHHKRWAGFMRRQSERLPVWARWSVFIAFIASSVCLCFYTAVSAFYARPVTAMPAVIKINRYALMTGSETLRPKTTVSENEYKKITGFKRYLDSMSATARGRLWVDSMLARRPGLTDSIAIIENIYLSQSNK